MNWKEQLLAELVIEEQRIAEANAKHERENVERNTRQNHDIFVRVFNVEPDSIDATGLIATKDGIRLQFYPNNGAYRVLVCDKCHKTTINRNIDDALDLARILRDESMEHECQFYCHGCESMVDIVNPKGGLCPRCEYPNPPYSPEELEAMTNFASGYLSAVDKGEGVPPEDIDEWVQLPGHTTIDIHFRTNDDPDSDNYHFVEAWAYRRDGKGLGSCEDELKLF